MVVFFVGTGARSANHSLTVMAPIGAARVSKRFPDTLDGHAIPLGIMLMRRFPLPNGIAIRIGNGHQ